MKKFTIHMRDGCKLYMEINIKYVGSVLHTINNSNGLVSVGNTENHVTVKLNSESTVFVHSINSDDITLISDFSTCKPMERPPTTAYPNTHKNMLG